MASLKYRQLCIVAEGVESAGIANCGARTQHVSEALTMFPDDMVDSGCVVAGMVGRGVR